MSAHIQGTKRQVFCHWGMPFKLNKTSSRVPDLPMHSGYSLCLVCGLTLGEKAALNDCDYLHSAAADNPGGCAYGLVHLGPDIDIHGKVATWVSQWSARDRTPKYTHYPMFLSRLGVNKGSVGVRLFARLPVHHILMFSRIHFSNHSRSLVNVTEITQITCHNMCHNTIMCGTMTQGRHSLPR